MRRCNRIGLCSGLLLWLVSGSAHAQLQPASVWFRSAAGCPDGSAFMQALSARDVSARLAQVGDAIDFVVTLGKSPDGHSSGVLERQTQTGTVAIRRVDDASCEQVADALALTLALAVQGGGESQGESATHAVPAPAEPAPSEPVPDTPAAAASLQPAAPSAAVTPARAGAAPGDEAAESTTGGKPPSSLQWSLGVHASVATGIAPDLLMGGAAFVDIGWVGDGALWRPVLRIGALFAAGSGSESARELRVRTIGGRLAGCPVALGAGALVARPCLALELGQLHGEVAGAGGGGASGLWAASEATARLSLRIGRGASLEAELGLLMPWTRYTFELANGEAVVDRVAGLGFAARLGAVMHF